MEKVKQLLQNKKAVAILAAALVLVLGSSLAFAGVFSGDSKEAAEVKSSTPEESVSTDRTVSISDEELVDSISLYNESAKTKDQIKQEHTTAVTIVQQRAKKQQAPVKEDLDDKKYRDFVIGAATDLEGLSPEEQKRVSNYAKEVADYDNKHKNKRIKELEDKAKKEGLTPGEKAELIDLLPIQSVKPLQPESLEPEEAGDTGVDKKKPGSNAPADPGKETEEEEPADNNEQQQPPANEEENQGDEGQQQPPADEDTGDENEEQQPPSQEEGNDEQQPPSEETNEEEPPANEEENNEENRDEDSNEEEPPVEEEEETLQGNSMKEANGYDRKKARDYAYQWWNKRNNEEYGYYSRAMGGCYDCWYDCTNFTSQAMKAGGLVEWKSDPWWYYSDTKPSYAWGLANSQFKHLEKRAEPATSLSELKVGDIVHGDLNGDGHINHSAIVTRIEYGRIYVTQHTTDKKDAPLHYWFWNGYTVYGWKMGTADNTPR
ncbi:amidase domain-containing protein [Desmospora profundinema]|uniref:Putative amidase domain-containing protein n=1 Tax=Desmospora profundinema TaxID=1571184 RepID=A0ABU1IQX0_9BACL|nr:amidase domain-containing protein [Desmospora profundinema]MDR6226818.1 hypothetical protein [Desmospora profundinema]